MTHPFAHLPRGLQAPFVGASLPKLHLGSSTALNPSVRAISVSAPSLAAAGTSHATHVLQESFSQQTWHTNKVFCKKFFCPFAVLWTLAPSRLPEVLQSWFTCPSTAQRLLYPNPSEMAEDGIMSSRMTPHNDGLHSKMIYENRFWFSSSSF